METEKEIDMSRTSKVNIACCGSNENLSLVSAGGNEVHGEKKPPKQ